MDELGSSDPDDFVNYSTPTAGISCVQPHLYVGTFMSEQNLELLLNNNISHVCQIGSELQPSHPEKFTYISVSCYDHHTEDLMRILRPCLEFLDNAILGGGNVLVHCMAGVSRSPALCCAYAMWKQRLSLADALALVSTAHPMTQPNAVFLEQLKSFESDFGCDIEKLPATRLEDIANPEGSEDGVGVGKGDGDDDADDDSDLGNNLTEADWL